MSLWKKKNVNIFALGAVCVVGIFSDFGAEVDFEGRKLQLDQSAAPAKGTSKVSTMVCVGTQHSSAFRMLIRSPLSLHRLNLV